MDWVSDSVEHLVGWRGWDVIVNASEASPIYVFSVCACGALIVFGVSSYILNRHLHRKDDLEHRRLLHEINKDTQIFRNAEKIRTLEKHTEKSRISQNSSALPSLNEIENTEDEGELK